MNAKLQVLVIDDDAVGRKMNPVCRREFQLRPIVSSTAG